MIDHQAPALVELADEVLRKLDTFFEPEWREQARRHAHRLAAVERGRRGGFARWAHRAP